MTLVELKQTFLKEMNCLLEAGKTKQAIKQMENSFFAETIDILKILGNAYHRIGKDTLAMQTFYFLSTYTDLSESDKFWIKFNLGIIACSKGKIESAKKILHKLEKDDPDNPLCLCELGNTYFEAKEYDVAEKYFVKTLKNLNNLASDYNKAQMCSYSGEFFKETDKTKIAIKLFEKALSYVPVHKNCILWLAECYEELEQNKRAKELYKKAKDYFPEDYSVQDYVDMKLEFLGEG